MNASLNYPPSGHLYPHLAHCIVLYCIVLNVPRDDQNCDNWKTDISLELQLISIVNGLLVGKKNVEN